MKKLLIALALISSSVSAQEIFATALNSAGGKIVLLSIKSDCSKNYRAMFSTLPTGETLYGCWVAAFDMIRVRYHDGAIRMYELGPNHWVIDPYFEKKMAKDKS